MSKPVLLGGGLLQVNLTGTSSECTCNVFSNIQARYLMMGSAFQHDHESFTKLSKAD